MEFIERVAAHPLARLVKLADLEDNMDLRRLHEPTEADRRRAEKYRRAREILAVRIKEAQSGLEVSPGEPNQTTRHSTRRVVLIDGHDRFGASCRHVAYIDNAGNLVLEGQDAGESVEAFWGDLDYEYWRVVHAEHVPRVLLELLKDRFDDSVKFSDWLRAKGIDYEFHSRV
jgi:hypothetical protein